MNSCLLKKRLSASNRTNQLCRFNLNSFRFVCPGKKNLLQIYWNVKESVYIRKEFKSHRTGLVHQHCRRFIVLGVKYGRHEVMWKHSPYPSSFPNLSIKSRIRIINFWTAFFKVKKGGIPVLIFSSFQIAFTLHVALNILFLYVEGTCKDQINGYQCQCQEGYTGKNCDVNIDECHSSPCKHGIMILF